MSVLRIQKRLCGSPVALEPVGELRRYRSDVVCEEQSELRVYMEHYQIGAGTVVLGGLSFLCHDGFI